VESRDYVFVGELRVAAPFSRASGIVALAVFTAVGLSDAALAQTIGSGSTTLVSSLSTSATPAFQGGTLEIDKAGTYANKFTLQGSVTTSTIDAFGKAGTLSGIISDAVSGTAGSLTITDSVGGGAVTFSGVNTYTGATTINAGTTLRWPVRGVSPHPAASTTAASSIFRPHPAAHPSFRSPAAVR